MVQGILLAIISLIAVIYLGIKLKPKFDGKKDCDSDCNCE